MSDPQNSSLHNKEPRASSLFSRISTLRPGKLIIGTYFTNPPFEFLENNQLVGFEVDFLKEVSKRLNLEPVFINTYWEKILDEIRNNEFDLIMGAITVTNDREKVISFSTPYLTTTLDIFINKNKTPKLTQLSDLFNQTVGIQNATTDYDVAIKMMDKGIFKNVKGYPFVDFESIVKDLLTGDIGSVMKVSPVAYYYVKKYPELEVLCAVPDDPQPLGFGFNKNNPLLLDAVNETQENLKKEGIYQRIYQKWEQQK